MAVEDTGFEEVEITGLFSVGGKPMVSLSIRNSSSFTLKIGQRSRGIKLLQVKGDDDPYIVLERNGLQGRVFLNKSGPFRANRVVGSDKLEKRLDDTGTTRIMYVVGESEPFSGMGVWYNKDGSKSKESVYEKGKLHGTEMRYTKDGSKRFEIPVYVDGKKHGTQITYRSDGSKEEETPYVKGKLHGTEVEYHRWGDKWRETPM